MKYHELETNKKRTSRRAGRGISSGLGKTAGRGTKGQRARTGSGRRPGFEGGQNPLMQRLPKLRGFKAYKPKAEVVYTGQLDAFGSKTVDTQALADAGIITSQYSRVKLVVKGDVTKKTTVKLPAASQAAIAAIQKAGGTFEQVAQTPRPASSKQQK